MRSRRCEAVPGALDFAPTAADTRVELAIGRDGACHRTYWIAQWPRLPVGPLFLTPLLLGAHAVHSVSVVIEPVASGPLAPRRSRPRSPATRRTRSSASGAGSARPRVGAASRTPPCEREEELASGHEEIRFAGYVTVTGRDEAELDEACERVEQAAQQAHLDLQPLWGEQDAGLRRTARCPSRAGSRASRRLL